MTRTRAGGVLGGLLLLFALLPTGAAFAATGSPVCVGVVVDFAAADPGAAPQTTCVQVASGASGADVLRARARQLGKPAPRVTPDGFLCAIDGYPRDTECATRATYYWSYWHRPADNGPWSYSSLGPTAYQPRDGQTEGWSFQTGTTARPPGGSPACRCRSSAGNESPPVEVGTAPSAGSDSDPRGGDTGRRAGLVAGLVAVVAIGTAAVWRTRRGR